MLEIDEDKERYWRNAKGELHRFDGPAYEGVNGDKEWWFRGKQYSEEEYRKKVGKYVRD